MATTKEKIKLAADTRKVFGRKVKQLRKTGLIPATVYGKEVKSVSIQVTLKDFNTVFSKVGETGLVELIIKSENKARPVLISNLQKNPVSDDILHFDLHQVDLKEKITATVPVELVGESQAVKDKLGILIQLANEVEVEALPTELPDKLEVDITNLKVVDDFINVEALKAPSGVEILTDKTQILVKIEALAKEEVVEAPAPVEGEEAPPATEETPEATTEGEKPVEEEKKEG